MLHALFQPYPATLQPELVPSAAQMRAEGVRDLESWLGGGREWATLLRLVGGLKHDSWVLEIGPGYGQATFAVRHLLSPKASYDGLESGPLKFKYLEENFAPALPYMRFKFADLKTPEHPAGAQTLDKYVFPFPSRTHDLVFAPAGLARFFPEDLGRIFHETARVMKPGAKALIGVHLLDNFKLDRPRPPAFASAAYDFTKPYRSYGEAFRIGGPNGKLRWTACQLELLEKLATAVGLVVPEPPLPGRWSGARNAVTDRDVLILQKPV